MLRGIARGTVLAALLALAGACGSTTTPTTPTIATITETYSGTLIPASAGTFSFTTLNGGSVTATLTAVTHTVTTVYSRPGSTTGHSVGWAPPK